MSDETKTEAEPGPSQTGKLAVEIGPAVLFMIVYNVAARGRPDEAIYIATGVFMVASLAALAWARWRQNRTPPMLVVSAVLITAFGGLTIALQNPLFVKIKPTIINLLYAAAIVGSLLVGRNVIKLLLDSAFELPDRIWRVLALRWAGWFVFLAVLNEFVWRTFSEAFWANFKVLGVIPLTLLFAVANTPLLMKHAKEPGADRGASKDAS
ncbi:MAG: septation protein A [Caulobacterales bacterium]|nr:septation protein A [Caulobacterales bacterium]